MNLTRKFSLVGAIWGLIIGYGAIAIATGLGVTFLWVVVYGDGPWSDNTAGILYGLAAVAFLGAVLICTAMGYLYGKRAGALAAAEQAGEHRRAHLLIGGAVLGLLLGGYQLHGLNSVLEIRQGWLDRILAERHVIAALQVRERADHRGLEVAVSAPGQREGRYLLELQILDGGGRPVHEQREEMDAPAHEFNHAVSVEYSQVLKGMLERGDRRQTSVAHRETLTVLARLTPVLDRRELRALPNHAAMNYQAPDSPFHSERTQAHPLEFYVDGEQYWIAERGEWHGVPR